MVATSFSSTEGSLEILVYLINSAETGLQHRTYDDEDLAAVGGVNALEQQLRLETVWFSFLGRVAGERTSAGITFSTKDLAMLPGPRVCARQIGHRHPAYGLGQIESHIFDSISLAISEYLNAWKGEEEELEAAYEAKEIKLSSNQLRCLASELLASQQAHDVVEVITRKYLSDFETPAGIPYVDDVIADFPITIRVRLRWGHRTPVVADLLPPSCC